MNEREIRERIDQHGRDAGIEVGSEMWRWMTEGYAQEMARLYSQSSRLIDRYVAWRRPWWARAIAWGFAGYYAVKR